MATLTAAGQRFFVQWLGRSASVRSADPVREPAAPTVVMLHGLLVGNVATWYVTAAPRLAEAGPVLLYDLRGHGKSEASPRGYSLRCMVDDLLALCAAAGLDEQRPIDLVGHSYGGLVALCCALWHPGRVRRLALVETPLPPFDLGGLRALRGVALHEVAQHMPMPDGLRREMSRDGRRSRRLWQRIQRLVSETTLLQDLEGLEPLPRSALRQLDVPVLLLYGDRSELSDAAERLRDDLPRARLQRVAGGHFLPLESKEAVTTALASFLKRDTARAPQELA